MNILCFTLIIPETVDWALESNDLSTVFSVSGHLMAPVIAHAFCNHMGFPAFSEVRGYPQPTRSKLIALFVIGLVLWLFLLLPLTAPWLYSNDVYAA